MFSRWPIRTVDPLVRLEQVFEDMKAKQNSFYPIGFYWLMKYTYLFPTCFGRLYYNKHVSTLGATLFPGPMTTPTFSGCAVSDVSFYVGLPTGQMGEK